MHKETTARHDAAPAPLEHTTRLHYNGKEIILIGTAHVSKESAELVKCVIEAEQPDSVCIELDDKRYENMQNPKAWEETDIINVIKSHRVGLLLVNLALSAYQKKMAEKLNTQVGGEMLQGIRSAKKTGAQLVLADRDIQTTFLRIWRKLNLFEKAKLLFSLFIGDDDAEDIDDATLKEMMEGDMLESMLGDMRKSFPKIGDILIHERDQHLALKIREAPGSKVVAVLGAAHVPGVTAEIGKPIDLEEISTVPPKRPIGKIIGWMIPIVIIALVLYGFVTNAQVGLAQLSAWVLWNAGFSALFTLLAGGHILSILTAALAAPITSLNPLMAAGWFAGLVQASVQKPTVRDAEAVQTDILSFKGFFKNKLLKVLIVVVMANIGSMLGTFVGGLEIVRNLFS